MYGSSFCIVTRRPRDFRRRPSEEAVRPFPRLEATPPVTKMCFAKTFSFRPSSREIRRKATVPDDLAQSRAPVRRPDRATSAWIRCRDDLLRCDGRRDAPPVRRSPRRAAPITGAPTRWCSRSRRSSSGSRRSSPRSRWCSTTACSRRRPGRCATASCRSATSSRARVRCSSRSCGSPTSSGCARWTRRGCSSVAAGVLLTVAVYSCARHVTSRGNALLAAGAGHHERLGAVGHGAGERRRPVARAVGARGRVRAALPRRTHACAPRCAWGSPRAARCRSRRCRCRRW